MDGCSVMYHNVCPRFSTQHDRIYIPSAARSRRVLDTMANNPPIGGMSSAPTKMYFWIACPASEMCSWSLPPHRRALAMRNSICVVGGACCGVRTGLPWLSIVCANQQQTARARQPNQLCSCSAYRFLRWRRRESEDTSPLIDTGNNRFAWAAAKLATIRLGDTQGTTGRYDIRKNSLRLAIACNSLDAWAFPL